MENTPQNTPTEKFYLEKSKLDRILFIIGALCFITSAVLALAYSGFSTTSQSEPKVTLIPDEETLWYISIACGIIGGALMNYRKFLAAIPAGLIASLAITDITLAYISFRNSIYMAEILIPLGAGCFIGVWVYKFFHSVIYRKI